MLKRVLCGSMFPNSKSSSSVPMGELLVWFRNPCSLNQEYSGTLPPCDVVLILQEFCAQLKK